MNNSEQTTPNDKSAQSKPAQFNAQANVARVTCLSALAAGVCLGGGLSLPFLQALLVRAVPASLARWIETTLPANQLADLWPAPILMGGAVWGMVLGWGSGYHALWRFGVAGGAATLLGFIIVTSDPFLSFVNGLWPNTPLHFRFALEFTLGLGLAAGLTGAALGLTTRSWQMTLALLLAGSLTAIATATLVVIGLDRLGVRVGTGNAAMAKIAALGFLSTTSITGAVSGWILTWFRPGVERSN
jgi:hypothetical protein